MNRYISYFILVVVAITSSACGVSTPGGYVAGTTSYLAEYNQGTRGGK